MSIYKMTCDKFEQISTTTFQQKEKDIQRLLRDQPDVVEEGLFIVSEEFSNWQDAKLRIDLVGFGFGRTFGSNRTEENRDGGLF